MQNYTNKKYLAKQIADKSFLIDEQANILEYTLNLISWDFNRSLQTRPIEGLRLCAAGIVALGDALTEGTLHNIILATLLIEGLKLHFLHTFILLLQVGIVLQGQTLPRKRRAVAEASASGCAHRPTLISRAAANTTNLRLI